MRLRILGSAAGGAVPQWNCACLNCRTARKSGALITQSSAAVSADGKRWLLLNASPDLVFQFASFPPLSRCDHALRGSAVEAVVLTDGELDHVAGLLSLREQAFLRLACTHAVKELITAQFPILSALKAYCRIRHEPFPVHIAGIRISALELEDGSPPNYSRRAARRGDVVGLRLETAAGRRRCVYLPGLPKLTPQLDAWVADCDCLIVDGTFWSEREMISLGLARRSARDMGHVPIHGRHGTLEWLRGLDVPRKIYTHINNSNPILRRTSRERRTVERAGLEVSHDGMEIRI